MSHETDPQNITLLIGRMDGKLDLLLCYRTETDSRLSAIESRLGSVERWKSYVIGISVAIATVVSALAHKLGFIG